MKKIIICLSILINISAFSQSKVSGTVTYFFNQYQGDKVDIGAKVYLIDSLTFINTKYSKSLGDYESMKITRRLANIYIEDLTNLNGDADYNELLKEKRKLEKKNKHLKEKYKEKYNTLLMEIKPFEVKIKKKEEEVTYYINDLKEKKIFDDYEWIEYCADAFESFLRLTIGESEKIETRSVNGIGTYSFEKIENGSYYIIIRSKNRTGLNVLNSSGKVYVKKINIKNKDMDISKNFTLN
jgi:hypothetical protein